MFKLVPGHRGRYTETVVHSFAGPQYTGPGDGANPNGRLIMDAAGNLYGTTNLGGNGFGTVFKIDTSSVLTILHSFVTTEAKDPVGGLLMDSSGNLYGTTINGGTSNEGTVFKLAPSGNTYNETVLYSFSGANLPQPQGDLIQDASGNLYGITVYGGSGTNCTFNCGTVFKLDTSNSETAIYNFGGAPTDGGNPSAGLIVDAAGNRYGATYRGGSSANCAGGCGTVFKLDSSNHESVLYSFAGPQAGGAGADGMGPSGGLLMDATGNLYGMTIYGGTSGKGTVFKLAPNGNGGYSETVLYSFGGKAGEGLYPLGSLAMDANGNLYGVTQQGGTGTACATGCGTVFKLTP